MRKKEEIEHTPLVDVAPRRQYLERFPDLRRNRSPFLPGKSFFPVGQCVFQLDLISLQLLFQDRSLLSDRFPSREVFGLPELEHRVQLALVFLLDGDFAPQLVDVVEEGIEPVEVLL